MAVCLIGGVTGVLRENRRPVTDKHYHIPEKTTDRSLTNTITYQRKPQTGHWQTQSHTRENHRSVTDKHYHIPEKTTDLSLTNTITYQRKPPTGHWQTLLHTRENHRPVTDKHSHTRENHRPVTDKHYHIPEKTTDRSLTNTITYQRKPPTGHWQTLSHNVVSCTHRLSWSGTQNISDDILIV